MSRAREIRRKAEESPADAEEMLLAAMEDPDHALRDLPNVILTPHVSGPVGGRRADLGKYAVECVRIALSGETPPGAITLERLQTLA